MHIPTLDKYGLDENGNPIKGDVPHDSYNHEDPKDPGGEYEEIMESPNDPGNAYEALEDIGIDPNEYIDPNDNIKGTPPPTYNIDKNQDGIPDDQQ